MYVRSYVHTLQKRIYSQQIKVDVLVTEILSICTLAYYVVSCMCIVHTYICDTQANIIMYVACTKYTSIYLAYTNYIALTGIIYSVGMPP